MFYLDSQRTITRRESSVVRLQQIDDSDVSTTGREQSTARLFTESRITNNPPARTKGSVEKEIVTILFESMLTDIIESWDVLTPPEIVRDVSTTMSDVIISKKKKSIARLLKSKSKSKFEADLDSVQMRTIQQSWWCKPDEKVVIRFKNGNLYEGHTSMKSMDGNGRFQWADGTVYMGNFKDNEICGKGKIYWKDDTWYEGDFVGNLRHGHGLYVDSRRQRSYTGQWYCGTKHGSGTVYFSKTFKNSYSGDWDLNTIHGYGVREYDEWSGYQGNWDRFDLEGKGLMIWPNHDFFKGGFKENRMSGFGLYIWNTFFNNSMTLGSNIAYRGQWNKGERHGHGFLNFGSGLGSHYKGEFKNNKKHGAGRLVTNSGLIIQDKQIFTDDNLSTTIPRSSFSSYNNKNLTLQEPHMFDMCDESVGLLYHIQKALSNIDTEEEERDMIIDEFSINNKIFKDTISGQKSLQKKSEELKKPRDLGDLISFEEISLLNATKCYESQLKYIYYYYSNICNTKPVYFPTILIRLYLWQLYFDCNIYEKGLTLVEIDNIFHSNPEWLSKTAHNPFEEIYYWQFLHSLISIASKLYAKKQLPEVKPDTILESAFRTLMEKDILPGAGLCKGKLLEGYGHTIPIKGLYYLYRSLGEPHTIRTFLRAVRKPPHDADHSQPLLIETPEDKIIQGKNVYEFGDEICFIIDETLDIEEESYCQHHNLKLFNFGNLSTKCIINIFSKIFPQNNNKKIMDLEIQITFFEFLEAFILCATESVKLTEEEYNMWRQKFPVSPTL